MQIDTLHAELERLFDLESLIELARNTMGFDPDRIGGTAACGSFARALVSYCIDQDATEALCDAVRVLRPQSSAELDEARARGLDADKPINSGQTFAGISILRLVGTGRFGHCYAGKLAERHLRIKVLNRQALRDRRGLQRLGAFTRLLGRVSHPAFVSRVHPCSSSAASRALVSPPRGVPKLRSTWTRILPEIQPPRSNPPPGPADCPQPALASLRMHPPKTIIAGLDKSLPPQL